MNSTREFWLSRPKTVIHVCFLLVFLFSTTLTWREAMVLKNTYEVNQRIGLNTLTSGLERQWQRSLDELFFYRNMLLHAMQSPVENDNIRKQLQLYQHLRSQRTWQLTPNLKRTMPLNGIADSELPKYPLLQRNDGEDMRNELIAALEMSFILQLNDPRHNFHSRLWYISRSGFFLSSKPPSGDKETLESFDLLMQRPWFTLMTPEANPQRRLHWSKLYDGAFGEGKMVTASLPVDMDGSWYGVLAIDFTASRVSEFLQHVTPQPHLGSVLFYDRDFTLIAASPGSQPIREQLDAVEVNKLIAAVKKSEQGAMRFGTLFITWVKTNNSNGVMVNVDTLKEGLQGETGRITLVLVLMWMLFTLVLVLSHQAIIRLVTRMLKLQAQLSWRANYDGLTRMLNRTAFFDQAEGLARSSEQKQQAFALIQLDLDRFKQVNDTHGHQAGDRVLSHAAAILQETIRQKDAAGRVGGEEFCIALPDTSKEEAMAIAERVREKLARKQVPVSSTLLLHISASFGVASSEECGNYDFESLQSIADGRLYIAKESGRNRVCGEG